MRSAGGSTKSCSGPCPNKNPKQELCSTPPRYSKEFSNPQKRFGSQRNWLAGRNKTIKRRIVMRSKKTNISISLQIEPTTSQRRFFQSKTSSAGNDSFNTKEKNSNHCAKHMLDSTLERTKSYASNPTAPEIWQISKLTLVKKQTKKRHTDLAPNNLFMGYPVGNFCKLWTDVKPILPNHPSPYRSNRQSNRSTNGAHLQFMQTQFRLGYFMSSVPQKTDNYSFWVSSLFTISDIKNRSQASCLQSKNRSFFKEGAK